MALVHLQLAMFLVLLLGLDQELNLVHLLLAVSLALDLGTDLKMDMKC